MSQCLSSTASSPSHHQPHHHPHPRHRTSSSKANAKANAKISKAEKKQLLKELLTDSEDDDDLNDLLSRPCTFSVSKKRADADANADALQAQPESKTQPKAQQNDQAEASNQTSATATATSHSNSNNTKSLLEQASETARIFLNENIASKSELIPSHSKDLLWLKKGGKGSNTNNNVKWWPVLLPSNQDSLEAVNEHLLQRKSEKHVIVRYLGMKVPHKGEIETVHSNNLFPFDHKDVQRRHRRSTARAKSKRATASADADADADAENSTSKDDSNTNSNRNHKEATTMQWSQPNMDNYLKRLRTSMTKNKNNVELCVQSERIYLQLLLEHVLDCEQQQQQLQQQRQQENNDNGADIDNENASDAESKEKDDLVLSASSPDDNSKAHEYKFDVIANAAAQVTQDEEATSTSTSPSPPQCTEKHSNNARLAKQVRVLRAGDVIEYCPPHLVNTSSNRKQAVITQVMSKKDTFCLELHDGALLQADHLVKLVQRRIRGKLQVNVDAVNMDVGQFRLDTSGNDKIKIETVADQMSNLSARARRQIEQGCVDIINNEKAFHSVDPNAKRLRGDNDATSDTQEGSVATKKTKGGLR